jgi:AmmeMemoRadiSam system protein A
VNRHVKNRTAVLAATLSASVFFTAAGCTNTKENSMNEQNSAVWSPQLSQTEEQTLFAIANDTLSWCVEDSSGSFDFGKYEITEKLKIQTATFVTLKINGRLRGCIGSLEPVAPLYESVHDNAVNAALRDHRFPPVGTNELTQLEVHISILSPIVPIKTLDEFRIGEHGIILTKGYNRAVYLPEVATEQGWTVEETLTSLSQKAGLPPDAWKTGTTFEVFSSVGIGE